MNNFQAEAVAMRRAQRATQTGDYGKKTDLRFQDLRMQVCSFQNKINPLITDIARQHQGCFTWKALSRTRQHVGGRNPVCLFYFFRFLHVFCFASFASAASKATSRPKLFQGEGGLFPTSAADKLCPSGPLFMAAGCCIHLFIIVRLGHESTYYLITWMSFATCTHPITKVSCT